MGYLYEWGSPFTNFERERKKLVSQLRKKGIFDERVLEAMAQIPREMFVPAELRAMAYEDRPLSIGEGQTISQPFMVALMSQALAVRPGDKVLEIGTGSGYQTAILSSLGGWVYSIERYPELAQRARKLLTDLGYKNVTIQQGDGCKGLIEQAPFDGVIVTAGAPKVPHAFIDQLASGGRLIIPVGSKTYQRLLCLMKDDSILKVKEITGCIFVPLVGENGWDE